MGGKESEATIYYPIIDENTHKRTVICEEVEFNLNPKNIDC